jgi:hypothetical protein
MEFALEKLASIPSITTAHIYDTSIKIAYAFAKV